MTSKTVYMIGDVDIKNIEEYKKYMEKVKPMIENYGGEYLIRGGEIDALETNLWKPTRIVLVKFPNKKLAMEWYNSDEYRPYKDIRFDNAISNILIVEGL
ncbi:DUF1330 domain-containing protein [Alphaproteobacteria bacterium]|nr:DUF1330 domain-containing protein [Alphaproteobacteria bacterium]